MDEVDGMAYTVSLSCGKTRTYSLFVETRNVVNQAI